MALKDLFKIKKEVKRPQIKNSGFETMREFLNYLNANKIKWRAVLYDNGQWRVNVGKSDKNDQPLIEEQPQEEAKP